MSLIISALTFSLSAISAPQLQEQSAEIPAGIPLPTVPQRLHQWEEFVAGDIGSDDITLWHHLNAQDLLGGSLEFDYQDYRLERAETLAALNDWSDNELRNWISATAPKPVQIEFSVRQTSLMADPAKAPMLAFGSQPLHPGQPTSLGHSSARPVVDDIDVEIAQGSSIADPDICWMFEGVSLAVNAVPLNQDRWWVEFAMTISRPEAGEIIETGNPNIVGKARESSQVLEFGGPLLVKAGQTATLQLPGIEPGSKIEVQLKLSGESQPAIYPAGRFIAVDLPTYPLDPGMQGLLEDADDKFIWSSPTGLLVVEADGGAMIAEELAATAAEITAAQLTLSAAVPGDRNEGVMLQIPGVVGREYSFAVGKAFDVLMDWDVEVASSSRIPDPDFSRVFEGFVGTISARAASGRIDGTLLEAEFSRIRMGEATPLTLGGELLPNDESKRHMGPVHVLCERPIRSAARFQWQGGLTDVRITKSLPQDLGMGGVLSLRLKALEAVDG